MSSKLYKQAFNTHSGQMSVCLAVAAVSKFSILSNLQFCGVGGGDAVASLHAVALLQLGEGTHETSVGSIQRRYTLLLQIETIRPKSVL